MLAVVLVSWFQKHEEPDEEETVEIQAVSSTSFSGQFTDQTLVFVQGFFLFVQVNHPVREQKALCNKHRNTEQLDM